LQKIRPRRIGIMFGDLIPNDHSENKRSLNVLHTSTFALYMPG
jgi:hypothetical protein